MSKLVFILSIILITFAVIMFVVDFLPIDMFNSSNQEMYIKSVSSNSFSWVSYRVHALVLGIVLFALNKYTNLFGG
ncbi:hypothetical protein RI845_00245 [Thalassotalea nanhaiensis]|uniref:DUF1772 domain-containing protein n=1 Tax=Thalassotalea nanhaiensis TaxID=3065648 RepID=A0ABY9TIL0_9GAMM|nr:hypothetical protein RI845_00245 [Colwelliaceae bacterium SQ345]